MLMSYCLIKAEKPNETFEMHALVQLAMRMHLEKKGRIRQFKHSFVSLLADAFPNGKFSTWETCRRLFVHVERATRHKPEDPALLVRWASLLFDGGEYAFLQRNYAPAMRLEEQALAVMEKELGPEHRRTIKVMTRLAQVYQKQHGFREAKALSIRAVETSKKKWGLEDTIAIHSERLWAALCRQQGRLTKSRKILIPLLDRAKRKYGLRHHSTHMCMRTLLLTHSCLCQWAEAEALHRQLQESKDMSRLKDPHEVAIMRHFAIVLGAQGDSSRLSYDPTQRVPEANPTFRARPRTRRALFQKGVCCDHDGQSTPDT